MCLLLNAYILLKVNAIHKNNQISANGLKISTVHGMNEHFEKTFCHVKIIV